MNELISVIVPCYNYAHFLPEALESVLAQTYKNWECIIVNDGSTDNTIDVAQHYCERDNRIKLLNKSNGGLSSARNMGLKNINGKFIQFLDADDKLHSTKFEKQCEILSRMKDIHVCYSDYMFFNNQGEIYDKAYRRVKIELDPLKDFNLYWGFDFVIPIHSPLIRNNLIKKNKIFFDETLHAREDWLFWIDMTRFGSKFKYIDEVLAYYRKHEKSMVYDPAHMLQNTFKACLKVYNLLPESYKQPFEQKYAEYLFKDFKSQFVKNRKDRSNKTRKIIILFKKLLSISK